MEKVLFENPLLKHIACCDICVTDNKKQGNFGTAFFKLGCCSYVKQAPHSIK
jgi:hypothetical protein